MDSAASLVDIMPAQFRVIVTRRPKYACRSCTDGVAQAAAPARLIPGGMPTEVTVARVLFSASTEKSCMLRSRATKVRQHNC